MKSEFTAIIESAPEGGYWAICPEVPGANGQGETVNEAKENLRQAIELILEDRREDLFRGLPEDVIREKILIGNRGPSPVSVPGFATDIYPSCAAQRINAYTYT